MMKYCVTLIFSFLITLFTFAQGDVVFRGVVHGLGTGGKVYLGNRGLGIGQTFIDVKYDSAFTKNDTFEFAKRHFDHVGYYSININENQGWQTFLIDTGKIFIETNVDSFGYKQKAIGSLNNDIFKNFMINIYQPFTDTLAIAQRKYEDKMNSGDTLTALEIKDAAYLKYKNLTIQFFEKNLPLSPFSAFQALTYRREIQAFPDEELYQYFRKLPRHEQENPYWKDLVYKLGGKMKENISEGKRIPNFTFIDSTRGKHKLSSFKGNYILLDFWASWCSPCLAMAPKLDSFLTQLQGSAITALAVNVDNSFDSFLKSKDKYKADVMQAYTGAYANSNIVKYFAISQIPYMVLLDKNRKIVGTFADFEQFVAFVNSHPHLL